MRVRALTDAERQIVETGLRSADAVVLRRCQIMLASTRGETAPRIAAHLGCCAQTVRDVLHAFNTDGTATLARGSTRPHTIRVAIDAAGGERLRDLLHTSPRDFGKPTSLWTLALVAEVCHAQGITSERVSGETIRNTRTRLDIRWQRAKHWITSPDLAYTQKKTGVTG